MACPGITALLVAAGGSSSMCPSCPAVDGSWSARLGAPREFNINPGSANTAFTYTPWSVAAHLTFPRLLSNPHLTLSHLIPTSPTTPNSQGAGGARRHGSGGGRGGRSAECCQCEDHGIQIPLHPTPQAAEVSATLPEKNPSCLPFPLHDSADVAALAAPAAPCLRCCYASMRSMHPLPLALLLPRRRMLEVVFLAVLTTSTWFLIAYTSPCLPVPGHHPAFPAPAMGGQVTSISIAGNGGIPQSTEEDEGWTKLRASLFPQLWCEKPGEYSAYGSMFFTPVTSALAKLYHAHDVSGLAQYAVLQAVALGTAGYRPGDSTVDDTRSISACTSTCNPKPQDLFRVPSVCQHQ